MFPPPSFGEGGEGSIFAHHRQSTVLATHHYIGSFFGIRPASRKLKSINLNSSPSKRFRRSPSPIHDPDIDASKSRWPPWSNCGPPDQPNRSHIKILSELIRIIVTRWRVESTRNQWHLFFGPKGLVHPTVAQCWGEGSTPPRSKDHNVEGLRTGGREGLKSDHSSKSLKSPGEDSGVPFARTGQSKDHREFYWHRIWTAKTMCCDLPSITIIGHV
jgi:hypothetical protein